MVEFLLLNDFEVLSVEGGFSGDGIIIPEADLGTLIEVRRSETFASDLSVLAGYLGSLLDNTNNALTPGFGSDFSFTPLFTWLADLILDFVFGLDEDGFYVLGSSALLLGITGGGLFSGSGRVGSRDSITVNGTVSVDQTVGLHLLDPSERYRIADLASNIADSIVALSNGSNALTLNGTAGPVNFEFSLDVTLVSDLLNRSVDVSIETALAGTISLPGLQDEAGESADLSFTGSYNSVEDSWQLNVVLTETLFLGGQEISDFELTLTLSSNSFSGTGTASISFDTFEVLGTQLEVAVNISFDEDAFLATAVVEADELTYKSSEDTVLFIGTGFVATLTVGANYEGGDLTGGLSFTLATAQFAPGSPGFTASVQDSSEDGVAIAGSFDLSEEVVTLQLDSLLLTVPGVLQLSAAGVVFRYDRRDDSPDQEFFRIEDLDVELIALRNQSATDPPVIQATELVVRKDGISIGSAAVNLGNIEIEGILGFNDAAITLDSVFLSYTSAPSGNISISSSSGFLFAGDGFISAQINDSSSDGVAIAGSLDLGTGAFNFSLDEVVVTIGEAFVLLSSGINLSFDPNGDASQEIANVGTASLTAVALDGLSAVILEDLSIRADGFELGSLILGVPAGETVSIGDAITFTGARVELTNFGVSFATGEISGTAALLVDGLELFPDNDAINLTVSDFNAQFDFSDGSGALKIEIGVFRLEVGEAIAISANGVVLTPGDETILVIEDAEIRSPLLDQLDAGVIDTFVVTRTGFSIASASIGSVDGQTVAIGDFLTFEGARIEVTNFAFDFTDGSFSGAVVLTVASLELFPGSNFIQVTTSGLSIGFDFEEGRNGSLEISVDVFVLSIGEAIRLETENVSITPGSDVLTTIGSATVTSPALEGLASATLEDLEVRTTGFSLGSFNIGTQGGQDISLSDFVTIAGVSIAISNFSYTFAGDEVSGTIAVVVDNILFFPGSDVIQSEMSGITAEFDFSPTGLGNLNISVGSFSLLIGNALAINADGVVIRPGAQVIAQIQTGSVSAPEFSALPSVNLEVLEITRTGVYFGQFCHSSG
ncbi:MAG: hypothetical protein LR015_14360 [Verrucomicrobia bacterium]|nr:hypothetical protein [Verrucomicrobiota bacterium]